MTVALDITPAADLVLVDLTGLRMSDELRAAMEADIRRLAERTARHTHDGRDHLAGAFEAAVELALALRTDAEEHSLTGGRVPKMYVSALQLAITLRQEMFDRDDTKASIEAFPRS